MTGRGVAIQGALAAAGLVAAYATWQRGPELETGEALVLDVTQGDLEKVRYEEDKTFAELIRGRDENGPMVTVHVSGFDATDVPMPSGHPSVVTRQPEREVRGNEAAKRLFERFAPLRASRALGKLGDAVLKDLGLQTTKKHIEVTARGVKHRYAIAPAPPGGTDPYLRDEGDGTVYVVARQILTDLEAASTNLVERRLHPFLMQDFDALLISSGGKTKEFTVKRLEGRPDVQLVPKATPDKPDTTAQNWHERVFRLFPAEVMGKGEQPSSGAPVVALRIEYRSRGRVLGWTELARPATGQSGGGPSELYARSDFSAGWMKLSGDAPALLTEGEQLVAR